MYSSKNELQKSGRGHNPIFESVVSICDVSVGFGKGSTKKEADINAANQALSHFGDNGKIPSILTYTGKKFLIHKSAQTKRAFQEAISFVFCSSNNSLDDSDIVLDSWRDWGTDFNNDCAALGQFD